MRLHYELFGHRSPVWVELDMTAVSTWLEHMPGGRIAYHDAGGVMTRSIEAGDSGPAVVMLHGVGGHAECYIRNVSLLAREGFRVHSIDMLGHGETDKPSGNYRIDDYVRHLRDVVEVVGAGEPVHIVGESLGGWVALRFALAHPTAVATVASVVGAGLRPVEPTEQELRGWEQLRTRSADALADSSWDAWRSRMNWLVHNPASMPDEMVAIRVQLYSNPAMVETAKSIYAGLNDSYGWDAPERNLTLRPDDLGRLEVPVLYLWTDHNPTTPASVATAAAELTPKGSFVLMEDCGHWPQYEEPSVFNRILADYLSDAP